MRKLPMALAALSAALMASAFAQPAVSTAAEKTVPLRHRNGLPDMSITVQASFDVKIIDVTDHVPGTVKLHPGDEVVVATDPRESSCCGDSSKTIETVTVAYHNPDGAGPPVLVFSPAGGAPIVRAFIGNNKGTATLTIEITCRNSDGHLIVQTKTVTVVVR